MNHTIYYVGNFGEPLENAAGKRVYGISLCLESMGYEVILIGKSSINQQTRTAKTFSKKIYYYTFPQLGLLNCKKYVNYIFDIIKSRKDSPDAIIRYGSPALALFDYYLLKKCEKNSIPVIADVVDWIPSSSGNVFFDFVKKIDTFAEKVIFNSKSKYVIAISSYLANYYKQKGCNTIIIPPLVEFYTKNISDNKELIFIYAGIPFRLGHKITNSKYVKDRLDIAVETMCAILDKCNNFQFHIYGITQKEYLVSYPNHKNVLEKLANNVVFWGKCGMADVMNAVSKADYCILLRDVNRGTQAGFPTKVVESMSQGTPVITTKTSDLTNYIINGKNGHFVDIESIDRLYDQLLDIIKTDSNILANMKNCCFDGQDFIYTKFTPRLEAFISEVIQN